MVLPWPGSEVSPEGVRTLAEATCRQCRAELRSASRATFCSGKCRAAWHRRRHEAERAALERDLRAQLADSRRREQEAHAALDGIRVWPKLRCLDLTMGARPESPTESNQKFERAPGPAASPRPALSARGTRPGAPDRRPRAAWLHPRARATGRFRSTPGARSKPVPAPAVASARWLVLSTSWRGRRHLGGAGHLINGGGGCLSGGTKAGADFPTGPRVLMYW